MSTNIRQWLQVSQEQDTAPTHIQDGETPKEDFSDATNVDSSDADTAKPATAELDAASDGADKGKDVDQGHQKVHLPDSDSKVSNEENITEESGGKKDDIDAEDDTSSGKAVKPEDVDGVKEGDVTKANLKAGDGETGGDEDVKDADDYVKPDAEGAQTHNVSSESVDFVIPSEEQYDEVVAMETIGEHLDQFDRLRTTLASYETILAKGMEEHDGVYGETAEAIRIGLENLDPEFGGIEVIPSMEAFGQTSSRHTATYVSLEAIGERTKQIVEAAKRAIAKLFDMLYDLWTKVTGGVKRTRTRLEKTVQELDKLDGDASVQTSVAGSARLMIGTQFMGNDPRGVAAIEDIASYIYEDYPKLAIGIVGETTKLLKDLPVFRKRGNSYQSAAIETSNALQEANEDFKKIPKKYLKQLPSQTAASPDEVSGVVKKKGVSVQRSHRLPGGYAMIQYLDTDRQKTSLGAVGHASTANASLGDTQYTGDISLMFSFDKMFYVGFVKLNGPSTAGKTETYRVPSVREMTDIVKRIKSVLDLVDKGAKTKDTYKQIRKQIDETITEMNNAAATPKFLNPAISTLRNISRILIQPSGAFNGYVVSTLNAYLSVMDHNIAEIAKNGKSSRSNDDTTSTNSNQRALPSA